jgi:hypothetical protein
MRMKCFRAKVYMFQVLCASPLRIPGCASRIQRHYSFLRYLSAPRFGLFLTPLRLARTAARVATGTCGVCDT